MQNEPRTIQQKRKRNENQPHVSNDIPLTYNDYRQQKQKKKRDRRNARRRKRTHRKMSPPPVDASVSMSVEAPRFKRHQEVSPQIFPVPIVYNDFDEPIPIFTSTDLHVEIFLPYSPGSDH